MATANLSFSVQSVSYGGNEWYSGGFFVGVTGSDNYRSRIVVNTGDLRLAKSEKLVVTVVLDGTSSPAGTYAVLTKDGSFTPKTALSSDTVGGNVHMPSAALLNSAIAESYPYEDQDGTKVHTGSNKGYGFVYYYVFDTEQLKSNETYYIYVVRNIYTGCGTTSGYTVGSNSKMTCVLTYKDHYTINFDSVGIGPSPSAIEVLVGDSVELPTITADGYAFFGWANSAGAAEGITGIYTPTGSVTLYAVWITVYTVSFDNNGHGVQLDPVKVNAGESIQLPVITDPNYKLVGWSATASESDAMLGQYTPSESVVLYAVWVSLSSIVYVNHNGAAIPCRVNINVDGKSVPCIAYYNDNGKAVRV